MISMPTSSKKELIENYELKKKEIQILKAEYFKLVPKNFVVDIEFEPESKILTIPDQISIKIYKIKEVNKKDNLEVVSRNWNLKPDSKELLETVKTIGWTFETIKTVKNLLASANCISIENGKVATIGYARSGMGKYSYKLFERTLSKTQEQEYNNGCEYIYYKENIVLEYGGGAFGPQCFEQD